MYRPSAVCVSKEWLTSLESSLVAAPVTARAAFRLKGPRKRDILAKTRCASGESRCHEVSKTARMLLCRAGRSRTFLSRKSSPCSSSPAIAARERVSVHVAASSRASGIPATRRQICCK